MAITTHSHTSVRFPRRLKVLTRGDTPLPEMTRSTEWQLIVLGRSAYQLFRARQRMKRDKEIHDLARSKILSGVPDGIYGFRITGKRAVKVLLARAELKTVKDNAAFFAYLGEHAETVIKGFKVVPDSAKVDYGTLLLVLERMVQSRLGAKVVPQVDTAKLDELIATGELKPAEEFFEEDAGPVRVLVEVTP